MLMRTVEEAPDAEVRQAAEPSLEYLRGFARDIVDQGYLIRTKDDEGTPHVPRRDDGTIKDLASLVMWEDFIPNAECTGKIGAALVGYGEALDNACEDGNEPDFETIATTQHYFNYAIIRYFHIAAVYNALMHGEHDAARELLVGLAERADNILHDEEMPHYDSSRWWPDAAAFLVAAAAAGLPLTNEEARLVQEQYGLSAEHYGEFAYWDPWDDSVEDGQFPYVPDRGPAVRSTTLGYLLEYCYSPFKNPAGAEFVDCEKIADPEAW